MIKIDMGKAIYISDDLPKQIHDNQIEVIINECPDGAREIIIQPWEPASNYMLNSQEFNDLRAEVKELEETISQLRADLLFLKYKPLKI